MTSPLSNRMPRGIPFIIANEFAERFCFYGINSILALYLVQFLHFGEAQSTTWGSLFKSGAYFFPLLGAVVSDVFWAKYRTVVTFSIAYCAGCAVLALAREPQMIAAGLFLIAFGTGGIKPCVSTNVGDQFTAGNQHLIERAFSLFYLAVNSGSLISIMLCPWLLPKYGPTVAFGMPAIMMFVATVVFWAGRQRFAVVPPAGKVWLRDILSANGLATIGRLLVIYLFIAFFWALWDQSNGTTWSLQARSDLMDKDVGFMTLLPAQVQAVNGLLILILAPGFSYFVYPFVGRFVTVTPLRKIGAGLFITASSFLVIASIEARIQAGVTVSVWWQILAYVVLTAGEVLVSITGLEYSYKQAPLTMKSFIMALFLLSISAGNLFTAAVNHYMVRPLQASAIESGPATWVSVSGAPAPIVSGQKIDFNGATGIEVVGADGKAEPLGGTYLVSQVEPGTGRVQLMDAVTRKPVASRGSFDAAKATVSTYALVGPAYFIFFSVIMAVVGVLFVIVAYFVRETTYVRGEEQGAVPA